MKGSIDELSAFVNNMIYVVTVCPDISGQTAA